MSAVNSINLVGNVGNASTVEFENGGRLLKISLATNEYYKDKDGEKKQVTDWHTIIVRGKLGESIAEYIVKGVMLAVEGSLHYRTYEDNEGKNHYVSEIIASSVQILGGGKKGENTEPSEDAEPVKPKDDKKK